MNDQTPYLDQLNKDQREAVEATEGPSMVIAGAGSGKTRVLTYRIAHLLKNGADAFNILALTFTNKAAREMKERIATIIGDTEARNIWMGTFHSVFARILRSESEKIGYPSNFTIYDTQDAKNLIKTIVKEFGLDEKAYKPNLVYNRISSAKNNLISPAAYMQNTEIQAEDRQMAKPRIGEVYREYARRCFRAGAMDFDDLLYKTNVLLRDHHDVLHKYQHRFKYILVDEYQDTNFSQYLIVKKLAAVYENVCVVGDDAQSIYAFRGANIQNILNFQNDYPDVKVFKLEQNYRSTRNIVNAANSIIAKNKDQIKKEVWTENISGNKIKIHKTLTDNEEGLLVAQTIFEKKMNEQADNKDFVILYRTNAQSRSMEEALRKKNIPYKIYGGLSFYQRKEIKDLISYFRLVVNPKDDEALKRIINYPARGIGKTTLERLTVAASEKEITLWETLIKPENLPRGINSGIRKKLEEFTTMIKSLRSKVDTADAYEIGSETASSSGILKELYTDRTPEGISRYENIQELLNGMKEFTEQRREQDSEEPLTLDAFLQDVALLTDLDQEDPEDLDKVSLMTIHSAKGLEFPYVFIVGLEENLFPSQMALNTRSELEEERRLFYVALTRAQTEVNLSYSASRYRWGQLIYSEPSRFLEEIDAQYIDETSVPAEKQSSGEDFEAARQSYKGTGTKAKKQSRPPKRNLVKVSTSRTAGSAEEYSTPSDLQVGMKVEHRKFGEGKVIHMEGAPPNQKATVYFPDIGEKQLLLKFAKLKVLS